MAVKKPIHITVLCTPPKGEAKISVMSFWSVHLHFFIQIHEITNVNLSTLLKIELTYYWLPISTAVC